MVLSTNNYLRIVGIKKMRVVRKINQILKALGKTYRGVNPHAIFR
ncbi:hypothetical protein Q7O_003797 [Pectobacterium carotovorum subsp. carotovorum PCCS1]|nr:hypothetical protein [Pectobacterium carotovorum subsp. carotovorum PCCS1]